MKPVLQMQLPANVAWPWPLHVAASLYWQMLPWYPGLHEQVIVNGSQEP